MIENGKYKTQIEHRMTSVETKVDSILNNHLPHISEDIKELKGILNNHIVTEEGQMQDVINKIGGIKLGTPAWITVIFSLLTALIVYVLTN